VAGMTSLILAFLPAALVNNYRVQEVPANKSLYIVTGITCLLIFTSMLFKIMHWPGAGILLTISLPFPYVVFLPVFLVVTAKNKNFSIYNTVAVLFLLAVMSVVSALLALNVSKGIMTDSLKISGNYNRIEQSLRNAELRAEETPLLLKIDEALALLNEYEAMVFSYEGISREQWISNPEISMDRKDRRMIRALKSERGRGEAHARLQEALSEIIVTAGRDPSTASLSEALPSILLMKEESEHFIWDNALFRQDVEQWVHAYLDGLRINLEMIKITL
ncbi:MAG: hypothetical protein JXR66_06510, partial [Bacteroidales bacterium]|nr:hypothetical protein [Bacteroidales bacterium]